MPNQPMQINRKEFQELLKEIRTYNKLDLFAQTIQTKYAAEMAGEDHEQRLKAQKDSNELLEKILIALTGTKSESKASIESSAKKDRKKSEGGAFSSLKDEFKLLKEDLKSGVAFGKRIGGGIVDAFKSPVQTLKSGAISAANINEQFYKQAGDILSTPADFNQQPVTPGIQNSAKQKIEAQGKAENPNIIDEPDEILAQESKKQTITFNELLDVTKESLDQLKSIRSSLEGSPISSSSQSTSKTAPIAAAPIVQEPGLLDQFGRVINIPGKTKAEAPKKGPAPKKTIGGRIAGAARSVGSGLLGAARFLGPAAAVAGAAYGGFEGYNRAGEVFGVDQQQATMGQKISSAVGGITDPFGLGYGDTVAKGVYGAGEKVGSFFGGIKESVSSKISSLKDSYTKNINTNKEYTERITKEVNKRIKERGIDVSTRQGSAEAIKIKQEVIKEFNNVQTNTSLNPGNASTQVNIPSPMPVGSGSVGVGSDVPTSSPSLELNQNIAPASRQSSNIGNVVDITSKENVVLRDEVSSTASAAPVVMNNVNNVNTTSITPIKGEPRPTHRGSALDRYNDRVAAY